MQNSNGVKFLSKDSLIKFLMAVLVFIAGWVGGQYSVSRRVLANSEAIANTTRMAEANREDISKLLIKQDANQLLVNAKLEAIALDIARLKVLVERQ